MSFDEGRTRRYKIGEVSKITGLSISKLRYYDKIGILSPNYRDRESDYRFYDAYQLEKACLIEQYQYFGFSLEQIATILRDPSHYFENISSITSSRLQELEKETAYLKKIYTKLSAHEKYIEFLLNEYKHKGYCVSVMEPQFYVLSDLKLDILYSSHFAAATNERVRMYAVDRKLPWYYADEFYQMSLRDDAVSTKGRFCIRFVTDETFISELPIYPETAEYCIKYMDHIETDKISYHVKNMLSEAQGEGFCPAFNFYYVGELAMEEPGTRESTLRQIVIPLKKI